MKVVTGAAGKGSINSAGGCSSGGNGNDIEDLVAGDGRKSNGGSNRGRSGRKLGRQSDCGPSSSRELQDTVEVTVEPDGHYLSGKEPRRWGLGGRNTAAVIALVVGAAAAGAAAVVVVARARRRG